MTPAREPGRLASLDAFRGFAIAGMILVNNPGHWGHVHAPLLHADWHGCTFTDLIFPFFLFISGLSLTLSLGRQPEAGRAALYLRLLRRAAIIFALGLGLNLLSNPHLATVRIPGVLQRIALALALAAPVVLWGTRRTVLQAILGAFALWTVLMLLVPVPGLDGVVAAGRLEPGQDFGAWLDRLVLGRHLWAKVGTWDPEGLMGTVTAAATVLLGVLAGQDLAAGRGGEARRWLGAGLALLALGWALGRWSVPLNKSLWTPSYVLFTGGWSLAALAAFRWALDEAPEPVQARARRICQPLSIFGMNALFLFVLAGLLGRLLLAVKVHPGGKELLLKNALFAQLARLPLALENASLLFALLFNLVMFAVAWGLWRKRWFIKV